MPFMTPNDIDSTCTVTLEIPSDNLAFAAFLGVLSDLARVENWETLGTETPEDTAAAFQTAYDGMTIDCA